MTVTRVSSPTDALLLRSSCWRSMQPDPSAARRRVSCSSRPPIVEAVRRLGTTTPSSSASHRSDAAESCWQSQPFGEIVTAVDLLDREHVADLDQILSRRHQLREIRRPRYRTPERTRHRSRDGGAPHLASDAQEWRQLAGLLRQV